MGGGGGGGDGEPEFQIAPMIDVLLVLLIFFMSITTSQVMKVDKDIQLPIAPDAKPKEKKTEKTGEDPLNIKWDPARQKATLTFDGHAFEQTSELVPILQKRKSAFESYRIIIRGDKRLPAIEVQKAMGVLGEAGLDNIAFSAQDK
jgi:biopolymer transport protein ExbD